jgi:hypothetical protein
VTRFTRAWILLLVLSGISTALAASGLGGGGIAAGLLLLAGLKAHVILSDYLGLSAAPAWLRGFDLALALLILGFLGLTLAA